MTQDGDVDTTALRVLRGAVAGLVAGVVAAFAMDRFQAAVTAITASGGDDAEPATSRAADDIARAATGAEVPDAAKPLAGQAVHYALGVALGIPYGIAAEFRPAVTAGGGTAFGLGVAGLLDEAVVPAVGLANPPWRTGAGTHLYALASHLVFGGVAEVTRRQTRSTLLPSAKA